MTIQVLGQRMMNYAPASARRFERVHIIVLLFYVYLAVVQRCVVLFHRSAILLLHTINDLCVTRFLIDWEVSGRSMRVYSGSSRLLN